MIINKFKNNITKYLDLGKNYFSNPIYGCKNCGYEGLQHRHGYYYRTVITFFSYHRIPILRLKCPSCNKTHAILPSFIIPYFQYSFNFIITTVFLIHIKKYSYSLILDIILSSLSSILSLALASLIYTISKSVWNLLIILPTVSLLFTRISILIWIILVSVMLFLRLSSFQIYPVISIIYIFSRCLAISFVNLRVYFNMDYLCPLLPFSLVFILFYPYLHFILAFLKQICFINCPFFSF